ncbi:unnamed protein product [Lactuca saligna]|uniref:TIR domain-containing protein n=1 Tax=Lactuca saligna TaxID=75948 RepID=A0AA35VGQ1_LACSI|nr:unnamed protein product [Lactuca saligna]
MQNTTTKWRTQNIFVEHSELKTDALKKMDKLKLLHLSHVQLEGSYENFSEDLRWLCWFGSQLRTIPSDLSMENLVAMDMSYSNLEVFDPPMVLQSLRILNLKDSHNLLEIRNMSRIPHLETLILWNCHSLVHICETIEDLTSLALLNLTGCINLLIGLKVSTSDGGVAKQPTFSFPHSLRRLFFNECNIEFTDSFCLSFSVHISLQYLNLGNNLFEFLPCYDHLKNLRVLDLSFCSRLKWLLCLPSTLAELYIYYCTSLERVTFESPRFTLQEFGYEGCSSLCEIEGFIKLFHIAKLEDNDLGHMKWLKEYQNYKVRLVGDDELTKGRSSSLQMLYEFDIMSTSLPDIKDPNMKPNYASKLSFLSFNVPSDPTSRRLKGLDVTFRYTISGDECAWFCKICTTKGVDLIYNPKVFGKPDSGKVGIWLSYWPIGNTLDIGDTVNVSIVAMRGLKVHECGVSLVYSDNEVAEETLINNKGWVEILGGDLSGFQLSTGVYYLCRRDFFELVEAGGLTRGWFRMLVGGSIDHIEVQGWRKTGRPRQSNPSITELRAVRCIIHGPELEEMYKMAEMSKSSFVDKCSEVTSSILGDTSSIASGSSSSNKASLDANDGIYDVFLNHSGRNTRNSFIDHLYTALKRAAIETFMDTPEFYIAAGMISPRVIKGSRSSIIVLSENYATSSICLDELLLILEQRREHNHFVLPIYYQVNPSDVRNQQNTFAINVKSSPKWTDHKVNLWKKGLKEVADLGGLVCLGPETTFLKEIVDTINNKLDGKEVHLPPNLSGMATRYQEINSWLNQSDFQFLVICGMGGSGKTKLANYIYNSNLKNFESTGFLEDIDRRCKTLDDLFELQEQLLKEILSGKKRKIPGVSPSTCTLEDALETKRMLIVLDDIAIYSQLLTLLGTGKINAQSKIIITTRENTDGWFKFRDWRCQVHEMRDD